jgi:hypothetical protein
VRVMRVMTPDYYQRLRDEAMAAPDWPALNAMLLTVAPGRVVPMPEPHIAEILKRGAVVTGNVRVRLGEPNACHLNACVQWLRDPRARIYAGYAYSGGVWRQHSWNVLGADIIDMHDLAEIRFGVALADPSKFALYVFGKEFDLGNIEPSEIKRRIGVRAERRFCEILVARLKSALASRSSFDAVNLLQLLEVGGVQTL